MRPETIAVLLHRLHVLWLLLGGACVRLLCWWVLIRLPFGGHLELPPTYERRFTSLIWLVSQMFNFCFKISIEKRKGRWEKRGINYFSKSKRAAPRRKSPFTFPGSMPRAKSASRFAYVGFCVFSEHRARFKKQRRPSDRTARLSVTEYPFFRRDVFQIGQTKRKGCIYKGIYVCQRKKHIQFIENSLSSHNFYSSILLFVASTGLDQYSTWAKADYLVHWYEVQSRTVAAAGACVSTFWEPIVALVAQLSSTGDFLERSHVLYLSPILTGTHLKEIFTGAEIAPIA